MFMEFAMDCKAVVPESDISLLYSVYRVPATNKEVKVPTWNTLQRQRPTMSFEVQEHQYIMANRDLFSIPSGINPLLSWKPAEENSLIEFSGILSRTIPELSDVTNEEIDEALDALKEDS